MNYVLFSALLVTSCILSFLAVTQVRRWAITGNHLDIPNERSSHQIPTPRGGGLGIFVVTVGMFLIFSNLFIADLPLLAIVSYCLSASVVALTGWRDDRHTVPAVTRLAAYSGAALAFVLAIGAVLTVHIPIVNETLYLATLPAVILTFVWLVGFINAFNFMDGIDGLAGTQAFIAGCAWSILFFSIQSWTLALLAGLIAATSLGFLFLNTPPAKIFMGDVGSTFLGFTLAALPVLTFQQVPNPRLLTTAAIIVSPFLFDSSLTFVRRALKREAVLRAHRSHLYQRLVKSELSHDQVTGLYALIALLSAVGGLLYYFGSEAIGVSVVILLLIVYAILAYGVSLRERKQAASIKHIETPLPNIPTYKENDTL